MLPVISAPQVGRASLAMPGGVTMRVGFSRRCIQWRDHMPKQAVIFDRFGTLIPPWPGLRDAGTHGIMAEALRVDPDLFSEVWRADHEARMIGPLEASLRRVTAALGLAEPD